MKPSMWSMKLCALSNLDSYEFIAKGIEAGELELRGSYFAISTAELWMQNDSGEFIKAPTS